MTAGNGPGPAVPARRDRSAAGRRPAGVLIRLTDRERDTVASRAAAQGISVQRYLLECAAAVEASGRVVETKTQRDEFLREMLDLRRLLANVANNVNQIARVANAGGFAAEADRSVVAFEAAGRASEQIYILVDKMLDPKRR